MVASAHFVAELVARIEGLGCALWLDGGWGVDALLGEQTRPHGDVDIVVEACDLNRIRDALSDRGFTLAQREDTRPWNFVLADAHDQQIDFHVITFDRDGNGTYGPPENGQAYPAEAFAGRGRVAAQPVSCMSVTFQLANRSGYELRDKDHHDLARLRARFGGVES